MKERRGITFDAWVFIPALLFLLLGVLRLNDLSLYTDSTRYVIWGTSLGQGKGWIDETQPEPEAYVVNAPLYPLLLSPVLAAAPMSVVAAKLWTILFGAGAVALFGWWLRRSYGLIAGIAGSLLLAFNPMMVVTSSEVLSEAPFLLAMIGTMIAADRWLETSSRPAMILLIIILPLLPLLREVSITLTGTLLLVLLSRKELKLSAAIAGLAVLFAAAWMYRNLVLIGAPATSQSSNINFIFEHVLTPASATFIEEFAARIALNLKGFGFQLGGMLLYSIPTTLIIEPSTAFKATASILSELKYAVFVVVPILMFTGIVRDFRTSAGAQVRVLFILAYGAVILTYPIHDVRFLLPLLVLMIFYMAGGAQWLISLVLKPGPIRSRLVIVTALLFMVPNFFCVYDLIRTNQSYVASPGSVPASIESPAAIFFSEPWNAMGSWIRSNTPDSVTIACSAKEIAPFVGDRKILEINDGVPPPMFETMLRDNATAYVLSVGLWEDVTSYEFTMRESQRFAFEPVYRVGRLRLYRIRSRWFTRDPAPSALPPVGDTLSSAGYLRLGRAALLSSQPEEAIRLFGESQLRQRTLQPFILFQQLIARTQAGDSTGTEALLGAMYTSNRSTTYLWASRLHTGTMNSLAEAKAHNDPQARSQQYYRVGRLVWDLGYRAHGLHLVMESIRTDPGFFEGLLWAWHFSIQTGDTAGAGKFLRTLRGIDTSNAVVKHFTALTQLWNQLKRTYRSSERSALRLTVARHYNELELPEDALDEIERALGESPANTEARAMYAEVFRNKEKRLAETAARISRIPCGYQTTGL